MAGEGVTGKGILTRFAVALVVVYATFNPGGYSFFHWAINPLLQGHMDVARAAVPAKLLAGLVLLGAWWFLVQATRRSIGWKGALLMLAILGTVVWMLIDWHILSAGSSTAVAHIILLALTIVLSIGMSWSHISRKISGQVDTDPVN
jgi:hypothetical protein